MPRKQNGFGKAQSFAFKDFDKTDRGKKKGAAGQYPSDRRYGSSVTRSVIEKYDLDANWSKWRKGYEYFNAAAWYKLETLNELTDSYETSQITSKLYQGTEFEIDVTFSGYKFATSGSDSANHYVMKRIVSSTVDLGTVTQVFNNPLTYRNRQLSSEIWVDVSNGPDSRLLLQMIGDRLTDGETEATLLNVLNSSNHPALYLGKSYDKQTEVEVTVPKASLVAGQGYENFKYQDLVGNVVYIEDFFVEKDKSSATQLTFDDAVDFFTVDVVDNETNKAIKILETDQRDLPPTIYDISSLTSIYESSSADYEITGNYIFDKGAYQKLFKKQLLTDEVVDSETGRFSYSILPFKILGVEEKGTDLVIKSIPSTTEIKLYSPTTEQLTLIFTDYSFTKTSLDEYDGEYYHNDKPGSDPWLLIDTDVDPWMDEVFTTGYSLRPAVVYACSCPSHSKSILSAPQETFDDNTKKMNRQKQYPLPTVMSQDDYSAIGKNQAAGKIESWEKEKDRMSYKQCKHSIATMFIEKKKTKEPNSYPSIESRLKFEKKLRDEITDVASRFNQSYKRGGITTLEVLFALAQGLNLDDVELAYVMLNNNF